MKSMQKKVHSVSMEAFMYPSEDRQKVLKALSFVMPFRKIKEEAIESYFGPKIIKITASTASQKQAEDTLRRISGALSDSDRAELIRSVEERLDDEGNFFMRFSKQEAFDEKLVLQYKGDVIKIVVKTACYPFNRENAKKNLVKMLEKN
ncbi:MAG: RNA-binding domain-containing protein [archaeon]